MSLSKFTGKLGIYHDRLLDHAGIVYFDEICEGELLFIARRYQASIRYFHYDQTKWHEINEDQYRELLYSFKLTWKGKPALNKLNKAILKKFQQQILGSSSNGSGKKPVQKTKISMRAKIFCPKCKHLLPAYCFKKRGNMHEWCNWCRGETPRYKHKQKPPDLGMVALEIIPKFVSEEDRYQAWLRPYQLADKIKPLIP